MYNVIKMADGGHVVAQETEVMAFLYGGVTFFFWTFVCVSSSLSLLFTGVQNQGSLNLPCSTPHSL